MSTEYLGDSVYIDEEEDGCLVLMTQNGMDSEGHPIIGNAIYLEPETLCVLQRYLANRKIKSEAC